MTITLPGTASLPKRKPRTARRRATFDTTLGRAILQAAAVIGFFALWEIGVRAGWISAFLVGSPFGIFADGYKMLMSGDLLSDTWYTLFEAILGFVIGTIFGSLLGLALWYSAFVARLVEPFIVAINSVPKIALAPIVVLWFGTGLVSKVMLSVSLTAIVALIAAYQAAKDADVDLQSLLISMGADKHQVFSRRWWSTLRRSSRPSASTSASAWSVVVGEFSHRRRVQDLNTVWVGLFTRWGSFFTT